MPTSKNIFYLNKESNFALSLPVGWEVVYENHYGEFPFFEPVRIVGPQGIKTKPYITIVTVFGGGTNNPLEYMEEAEREFRKLFMNFRLDSKNVHNIFLFPSAWMIFTYQNEAGFRKELNVSIFFVVRINESKILELRFQFICETDEQQADKDFTDFERIINSLQIGAAGIRLPQLTLAGVKSCLFCDKPFTDGEKPNAMINLKSHRLISICDKCKDKPENQPIDVLSDL
ncbi:MAG: hypothetical protein JNJ56_11965 [Ignavibacteria bacterium]|nr:hypothetical protein [Ignavibacteria bacterium]